MTADNRSTLWLAEDARAATGGTLSGGEGWEATGVSIDSRTLAPGDLFVALKGPNQDGHEYVAAAFKRGAAAALVSRDVPEAVSRHPTLRVPDTQTALEALGTAARDRCGAVRIAVTGSVGKTGTKEMLRQVLAAQGRTHASVASYNNLWGVPLTLARMPRDTVYGIFEIGMNHAGEISPLTRQVRPDIAIITAVAPVHMEFFSDLEQIARAKAEIFDGLSGRAVAILNQDSDYFGLLKETALKAGAKQVLGFGGHERAELRLSQWEPTETGSMGLCEILGSRVRVHVPIPGRHHMINALAVLGAVAAAGGDVGAAAQALATIKPPAGRGVARRVNVDGRNILLVDESYNANPTSMAAALETLGGRHPGAGGRRIAVLGDMLELGPQAEQFHAGLAEPILKASTDLVFLSGPLMKALWRRLPEEVRGAFAASPEDLIGPLRDSLKDEDIVMVKGSLGSGMGRVVTALLEAEEDAGETAGIRQTSPRLGETP